MLFSLPSVIVLSPLTFLLILLSETIHMSFLAG